MKTKQLVFLVYIIEMKKERESVTKSYIYEKMKFILLIDQIYKPYKLILYTNSMI